VETQATQSVRHLGLLSSVSGEGTIGTTHLFSVDVEEHFQVSAFERVVTRESWDDHPSRVEANTGVLLDLLAHHRITATFFTVGWVAERHPALIRRIAAEGHELASHSFWHTRVFRLTPEEFREECRRSKQVLEDLSGRAIHGFRAPSFSILPGTEWAFDVLLEEGYRYDSSLFPIRRPGYGYPNAPTTPHRIERENGTLFEFPLATTRFGGITLPAAGGAYLRFFPLAVTKRAFRELGRSGHPGMFYIHSWEIDPDQPRLPGHLLTRIRHYRGLTGTLPSMATLLQEFRFTSVADWLASHGSLA
jgi:polysaccharide deacetylase family protein (PEP-CTERM system associated)